MLRRATFSEEESRKAMTLKGCKTMIGEKFDSEALESWLAAIHYEEYFQLFFKAGYDMPTISRMTPEDLTAIGITKPSHRRKIKAEIQKLNISDGIPNYRPDTLAEWLKLLRLEEYHPILCHQGYDSIDRVIELTWEDLEEIGIKKLGHQKRLVLAIKRVRDLDSGVKRMSGNFEDTPAVLHPQSLAMVLNGTESNVFPGQVVPIQTSLRSKSATSPTCEISTSTPELKTFQQPDTLTTTLTNNSELNKGSDQKYNSMCYHRGYSSSGEDLVGGVMQNHQGKSLDTIDYYSSHRFQQLQQLQRYHNFHHNLHNTVYQPMITTKNGSSSGYDTDSEVVISNQNRHYDQYGSYELDGTATLHRPKGMIKAKPVAKIAAKTRQVIVESSNGINGGSNSSLYDASRFKQSSNHNQMPNSNRNSDNSLEEKTGGDGYKLLERKSWSSSGNSLGSSASSSTTGTSASSDISSCSSPAKSVLNYKGQSSNHQLLQHSLSIYASLKRKSTPPPPPKRTNSMKSTSSTGSYIYSSGMSIKESDGDESPTVLTPRGGSFETMQEQAFATCVKSLASRFSSTNTSTNYHLNNSHSEPPTPEPTSTPPPYKESSPPIPGRNHSTTPRSVSICEENNSFIDDEFPPPPSPLPPSTINCVGDEVDCMSRSLVMKSNRIGHSVINSPGSNRNTPEHTMSSSSSSESMPFANDNIGTIKQRLSNLDMNEATSPEKPFVPPPTSVMSAPSSVTTSPFATILRKPKNSFVVQSPDKSSSNGLAGPKPLVKKLSFGSPKQPGNCKSTSETIKSLCSPVYDLEQETKKSHSGLSLPTSPSASLSFSSTLRQQQTQAPSSSSLSSSSFSTISSSTTEVTTENTIDDIELMLANLSNQLDAILESELLSD